MSIPVAAKNALLGGLAIDQVGLHTDFPGVIGSNEVSGGSYARQACTFTTSSGGVRSLSAAVAFSLPVCTVRWVSFWSGTTYLFTAPNGGAQPKNFMAVPSTDVVHSVGHGFTEGGKVVFFNGTAPGGLVEGQVYYARDVFTDSFKVAATLGGPAIDLTSSASFGAVVSAITEDAYAVAGGTHQLTAASVVIPD